MSILLSTEDTKRKVEYTKTGVGYKSLGAVGAGNLVLYDVSHTPRKKTVQVH